MTSGLCQGLSILITYRLPRHFHLPETCSGNRWKAKHVFIKCEQLCVPHVQRCDDDQTVETLLSLWAGKFGQLLSIGGINDFHNRFISSLLHLKSSSAHFLGLSPLSSKSESISSTKNLSEVSFLFSVSSLSSLTRAFSFCLGLFFFGSYRSPTTH